MTTESAANSMNSKQEGLIQIVMCLAVIGLCLAGIGWAVVSGQLLTLDGILLTLICLTMAGIFSGMLAWQAVSAGWIKLPGKKSDEKSAGQGS
ncbi:MAG: hypothetical protein HY046_02810 [Acidobacteria bacterium]|nr:hypothetical protein [Acidobacteriota bacterium]